MSKCSLVATGYTIVLGAYVVDNGTMCCHIAGPY